MVHPSICRCSRCRPARAKWVQRLRLQFLCDTESAQLTASRSWLAGSPCRGYSWTHVMVVGTDRGTAAAAVAAASLLDCTVPVDVDSNRSRAVRLVRQRHGLTFYRLLIARGDQDGLVGCDVRSRLCAV